MVWFFFNPIFYRTGTICSMKSEICRSDPSACTAPLLWFNSGCYYLWVWEGPRMNACWVYHQRRLLSSSALISISDFIGSVVNNTAAICRNYVASAFPIFPGPILASTFLTFYSSNVQCFNMYNLLPQCEGWFCDFTRNMASALDTNYPNPIVQLSLPLPILLWSLLCLSVPSLLLWEFKMDFLVLGSAEQPIVGQVFKENCI